MRGQPESPVHHDAFAQRGRLDRVTVAQRWKHEPGDFPAQRREEQLFAHQRDAAAHHDNFRGEQRDGLGDGPAEHFAGMRQHALGNDVAGVGCLGHGACRQLIDVLLAAI